MSASSATDRPAKLERLRVLLDARGARELVLTSTENLAWLFDGARVTVPYSGPPVLRAVVSADGSIRVTAPVNEADRLRTEELPGVDVLAVPWHAGLPDPTAGQLVDTDLERELRAARAPLLPLERARYTALGSDIATAVTDVLRSARPTMTEQELAARLAHAVVAVGAEPVVVLVAGESRTAVRHPLPTRATLDRRAMAVVGARRHGLVVNLSRWVRFEPLGGDLDAALLEVEADAFASTRPGRALCDVLADIAASYPRHGFPPDSWLGHHQGGPTGYLGRDPKATPATTDPVVAGQAFAWNPSVPGGKVEDTVIVDADRIAVLTADPDWPTTMVRGIARPLPLDL